MAVGGFPFLGAFDAWLLGRRGGVMVPSPFLLRSPLLSLRGVGGAPLRLDRSGTGLGSPVLLGVRREAAGLGLGRQERFRALEVRLESRLLGEDDLPGTLVVGLALLVHGVFLDPTTDDVPHH